MGGLFGGEEEQTSTSTSQLEPWGPAASGLKQLVQRASQMGLTPAEYFPGQTFLSMNDDQRGALENQANIAGGYQANVMDPTMNAWQQQLAGPSSETFDTALARYSDEVKKNLERTILPDINSSFTQGGGRTSSRAGIAEGLAIGDSADSIANYGSQLALDFQKMGNQNQQLAMSMAPDMMNWGMMPGNLQNQIATALRGDDQNQLNEDMARYNFDNLGGQWSNLQAAFPMLYNTAGQFGEQSAEQKTTTESSSSPFSQIAGLALTAVGAMTGNPMLMAAGVGASGAMGGGGGGGAGNIGAGASNASGGFSQGTTNDMFNALWGA